MPLLVLDREALKEYRTASPEARKALMAEAESRAAAHKPSILYFLHIPKCGGTSVAHLMRSEYPGAVVMPKLNAASDPKHCLLEHVDDVFDVSFTAVRHPLTWYESWWRYLKSPKVTDRENTLGADGKPNFDTWIGEGVWHPLRSIAPCHAESFGAFLNNVIEAEPGFVSRMYDEYLNFSSGKLRTENILKIETIDEDYERFCAKYALQKPACTKHENQSIRSLATEWTPALREKMKMLEEPAMRYFQYD